MKDEESLIQKAKNGESEAFGQLYDSYVSRIYRFIFIRVSSKHDAEDLTSQVFSQAWENIEKYEIRGYPFSSWIYRIASNAVIDYYRTFKNNVSVDQVSEETFAIESTSEKSLDTELSVEEVKKAMQLLESDQQNVLIMKFVNGLSNKEIAEALQKTEGAIRVIQHRALKQLKNFLHEE